MFLQREKELENLNNRYNLEESSVNFIFGPKSSGKTYLVQEFSKDKKRLYFSNYEMIPIRFFTQMANTISNYFHGVDTVGNPFKSFLEVLKFLEKQDIKEKLIISFDDFQNLLKVDKNALNDFFKFWKKKLKNKNLQFIFVNSLLFDKKLNKDIEAIDSLVIKLDYLGFTTIKEFIPNTNRLDQLYIYSLLGTSPTTLKFYNPKIDFSENIYNLFLSPNSFLFDYGIRVLKSELSDIGTYSSILHAISKENNRIGDIADFLHVKSTYLTRYIQKLLDMMIIKKVVPIDENINSSKFGRYEIFDNTLKFWFSYIYPNLTKLQEKNVKDVSQVIQDEFISKTIFLTYKKCIKEFIYNNQKSLLGFLPTNIGSWWDNTNNSIDLIAYDNKTAAFIQILWEDKNVAESHQEKLKLSSNNFQTKLEKKYIIVTKNTFFK